MMRQTICAEPKRQPAQPLTSGMQFRRMRMQYISPSNKRAGSLNLYFFKMGIERDSLSVMAPLAALDIETASVPVQSLATPPRSLR